ncbi:hypothetical protein HMPREF0972_01723 [Actinomyces sp. oral taxon 848 str. F0332]|uniref:Uncharacterized protein n=1 Tax=Peptidiphaga gingivicola TaxID=2741497 RepID=A0A179B5S0_9ACTO|nr:hypothetical protein HMPREF0972_01723 [Actinomyces sp. oral taxon 848 str. F0332]OAP86471.1 hypothetical protein A4H34_04875 [Peptidiphaga gingivicola]
MKAADAGDGADWRQPAAPSSAARGRSDVVGQHGTMPSFADSLLVFRRLSSRATRAPRGFERRECGEGDCANGLPGRAFG